MYRQLGPPLDALIAALAGRQWGVVEHGQLLELGLTEDAIAHRLATGRLHRIHRGVYAVGHTALTAAGRRMAALLACGPNAVLSHQTAADVWGIRPSASPQIHVTIPDRSGRRRPGIVVHRPRRLSSTETTTHEGMAVTSVARTLLDLTPIIDVSSLRKTVERAEKLQVFDHDAVMQVMADHPGHNLRKLATAIAEAAPEPLRSDLESDFLALCRNHGLPRPEVNVRIGGYEVDFLWRAQRLAVETDGWAFHRTKDAFERDRRRDVDLALHGITVVRFTRHRVAHDAQAVARSIRHLLDDARAA